MSATVTLTLNLCPSSSIVTASHLSPHCYSFKSIPNPNINAFFSFSLSLSLFHHGRVGTCKKPVPKPSPSRRTVSLSRPIFLNFIYATLLSCLFKTYCFCILLEIHYSKLILYHALVRLIDNSLYHRVPAL